MNWTEQQKKHAIKIVPHNSPDVLFRYCTKEAAPLVFRYSCSLNYLKGCRCTDKYHICEKCDPHQSAWPTKFDWLCFWVDVRRNPSFWDHYLKEYDPHGTLNAAYGPLQPTIPT